MYTEYPECIQKDTDFLAPLGVVNGGWCLFKGLWNEPPPDSQSRGLAHADKSGPVVRDRDRAPLTAGKAQHGWARLRKRAGLPDGRLHDLRHSVGTFAALAGANAFVVRDLLGHRTLAMTGRYVERAADMVRATADAVSNRVAAALNAVSRTPASVHKLRR